MSEEELNIFKKHGIIEEDLNNVINDIKIRIDEAYLSNTGDFSDINKIITLDLKELYSINKTKAFYKVSDSILSYYKKNGVYLNSGLKTITNVLGSEPYSEIINEYEYIKEDLRKLKIKNKINNF